VANRLDDIRKKVDSVIIADGIDFEKYYDISDEETTKLKHVVDFYDDIESYIENGAVLHGSKLPFSALANKFRFRDGEVTLWTGYNGHRKSLMLGYASLEWLREKKKVCIASFEMKPLSTIKRMTAQYTGHHEALGYDQFSDFIGFAGHNLYLYDHQGNLSPKKLLGLIYYCAKELGVKHFVIDSLMRVVAGEDDYNAQKNFVVKLCDIAIKTDIHIHLVHHTKKGRSEEISGRYDAKGSGAISDNVHNSLVVWSDKDAKEKQSFDAVLKCDKQREGEWEGSILLKFDNLNLRFYELTTQD